MTETTAAGSMASAEGSVTTNDGVVIRYTDTGTGPTIVLIPGWSQTAAQWRKQIDDFSATNRVIAIDMRGHGASDKPEYGYRIARLAADLDAVLKTLGNETVTVVAHSMGCSVLWSYWDLYGGDRIEKLVLVDQPAVLVADPAWAEGEAAGMSAIFDYATISALNAGLASDAANAVTEQLISGMFTANVAPEDVSWTIEANLALPRRSAGTLLIDHAYQDWRDVLPRINVPTLVIGGEVSIFPAVGVRWVAEQISGATVRIFSAEEGGSHFMFWENSKLFNDTVRSFLR